MTQFHLSDKVAELLHAAVDGVEEVIMKLETRVAKLEESAVTVVPDAPSESEPDEGCHGYNHVPDEQSVDSPARQALRILVDQRAGLTGLIDKIEGELRA